MSTTGLHEMTTNNSSANISLTQYIQNTIGQRADQDLSNDVHHVRQLLQWITNPIHFEVISNIFSHEPTYGLIAAIERHIETQRILYDQAAVATQMVEQAATRIIHTPEFLTLELAIGAVQGQHPIPTTTPSTPSDIARAHRDNHNNTTPAPSDSENIPFRRNPTPFTSDRGPVRRDVLGRVITPTPPSSPERQLSTPYNPNITLSDDIPMTTTAEENPSTPPPSLPPSPEPLPTPPHQTTSLEIVKDSEVYQVPKDKRREILNQIPGRWARR